MFTADDEKYMRRCLQLAAAGLGSVSPNPMVGAVVVCDGKIVGEGYHHRCGEAHAEINAMSAVRDKALLRRSTLYVSLEPCSHVGRTPACADAIIREQIPAVVVGCTDPYFKVAGGGIRKLKAAGIDVKTGLLEAECQKLNRRFFTFHQKKRPYIILKWAQSTDGYIDRQRTPQSPVPQWITNDFCKLLVHKWRTEEDAFMVGRNTVELDNPQLTARLWPGRNPLRIVVDKNLTLNTKANIFDKQANTLIFNNLRDEICENIRYVKIDFSVDILPSVLQFLHSIELQSLVVEGGRELLQSFIAAGLWDEARVFVGDLWLAAGVPAPEFRAAPSRHYTFDDTKLFIFEHGAVV